MAQLVLGAVGAAIGSFAGPMGAQIGWVIGSAIGGALVANAAPDVRNQGPRLSDKNVQVSSYGAYIPTIHGTFRCAGNVIWSDLILETATETSQSAGGKGGGPSVITTTYSYSCSFAVLICEGPINGIRRVFANGKLIYSNTPEDDAETMAQSMTFADTMRVYLGDETQLPDPTMEAARGVGNVPAYRGRAYVVFTDLQLADFGNRVPQLSFEVTRGGTAPVLAEWATFDQDETKRHWAFVDVPYIDPGQPFIRAIGKLYSPGPYANNDFDIFRMFEFEPAGPNPIDLYTRTTQAHNAYPLPGVSDRLGLLYWRTDYEGGTTTTDPNHMVWMSEDLTTEDIAVPPEFKAYGQTSSTYAKFGDLLAISADANQAPAESKAVAVIGTSRLGYTVASRYDYPAQVQSICITDAHLFVIYHQTTPDVYILRITDFASGTALSDITLIGSSHRFSVSRSGVVHLATSDLTGTGRLYRFDGTGTGLQMILLATGLDLFEITKGGFCVSGSMIKGIQPTHKVSYDLIPYTINLAALLAEPIPLAEMVTAIVDAAGIDVTQLDVSELDQQVHGYGITRMGSARAALEPLMRAYSLYGVESDRKLKFKPRSAATPVVEIPFDDLATVEAGADHPEPAPFTRIQEAELPRSVAVNYANFESDYHTGTETAQRYQTSSVFDVVDELAIAMDPDEAATTSVRLLYEAWLARTPRTLQVQRKYAGLDAGDVINVETRRDQWSLLRIIDADDDGLLIKLSLIDQDGLVYQRTQAGAGSGNPPQTAISMTPATMLVLLDCPILRNRDDDPGHYAVLSPPRNAGWRGAALFGSPDNVAFSESGSVFDSTVMARTVTALADWNGNVMIDETNTVDIQLLGENVPVSITRDQLLDQFGNTSALVKPNGDVEILQFRNALQIDATTWRLSGLVRGLRGTEWAATGHLAGQNFVVLKASAMWRPDFGLSSIDSERYYSAVSFGRKLVDTLAQAFTNHGAGLMPLSVVNVRGSRTSGNLTVTWARRTRLIAEMADRVDVPLGEESEAYEVDILNAGVVVRTLSSTTQTVTYTSAQQTADFGSAQASISLIVYQLSAAIGRGYPTPATL